MKPSRRSGKLRTRCEEGSNTAPAAQRAPLPDRGLRRRRQVRPARRGGSGPHPPRRSWDRGWALELRRSAIEHRACRLTHTSGSPIRCRRGSGATRHDQHSSPTRGCPFVMVTRGEAGFVLPIGMRGGRDRPGRTALTEFARDLRVRDPDDASRPRPECPVDELPRGLGRPTGSHGLPVDPGGLHPDRVTRCSPNQSPSAVIPAMVVAKV